MIETTGPTSRVQTVTEITRSIKVLLENGFPFVSINGEVSNLRKPFSGHLYFTLKDNESQIKAVLFKQQQRYLLQNIADGDNVICRGRLSVYEPRGDYQIIVDSVDFAGEGALQFAFEQLKQMLAGQGLFDQSRKKKLPFLPTGIGLITSPHGAAIHDFLKTATGRFPSIPIEIYPVSVQGDKAVPEILTALQTVKMRGTCDMVILCRGGGSIEDLWAFNSEELARAVAGYDIPIVSAIGHEIDFTIVDFVADYRAATPTAAANLVPEKNQLKEAVSRLKQRLTSFFAHNIDSLRNRVTMQTRLLRDPSAAINTSRLRLDHLQSSLIRATLDSLRNQRHKIEHLNTLLYQHTPQHRINTHRTASHILANRLKTAIMQTFDRKLFPVKQAESLLSAYSPLAVLERGYSIVLKKSDQKVLRSNKQVAKGDLLEVQLHEGRIDCEVVTSQEDTLKTEDC